MKDLKTRLTERIVEWDPVDLISVTDKNEYDHEIDIIYMISESFYGILPMLSRQPWANHRYLNP